MAFGYVPLTQFRAPEGLDFRGLNEGLDVMRQNMEKNRLLQQSKELGQSLTQPQDSGGTYQTQAAPVNRLLGSPTQMTPAMGAAGAAGRYNPVASPGDPNLPAGMRNNNPGNIKFVPGLGYDGIVGPSMNKDQGDPQTVFDTPEHGMQAAAKLALRKYQGGKRTASDLIAGNMGWTPGNADAANNIARTMGVHPGEDLRLEDPNRMQSFLRALTLQEHGQASLAYGDDVYGAASGAGQSAARAQPTAVAQRASAPPQVAPRPSLNYAAGIKAALAQGNVAMAMQLQNAQQEEQNTAYTRQRQSTQDAQAAETHGLTTQAQRDALEHSAIGQIAAVAQVIQAEPDPARKAEQWDRLMASHPGFLRKMEAFGVDPKDVDGGTKLLIARAQGMPAPKQDQFTQIGEDGFGNKRFGFVNSATHQTFPATPDQGAGRAAVDPSIKGDAFLQTLEKPMADQVRALAEGRLAFPSGFALKSPYWQKMLQMVGQFDPQFDAVNYNARSRTRNDFTAGKSAQNIASFNTAIGHLDSLDKAIGGLNNGNYPMFNSIRNSVARNFGDTRFQGAEKQFLTAKTAVVDELTKAFRGSGGSVHDIEQWEHVINAADSPPALRQAVKSAVELLRSRIEAVGDQYNRGMGTTSGPLTLLSPHAQETISRLSGEAGAEQDKAAPAPLVRVNSADEARELIQSKKLQTGDHFTDEHGIDRVVH